MSPWAPRGADADDGAGTRTGGEGTSTRPVPCVRLALAASGRPGGRATAAAGDHYGLTTLQQDPVVVRDQRAVFDYVGKASKRQRVAVTDSDALPALARLRRRRTGPAELLVFRTARDWTRVHSEDVNNFLRHLSGSPFSAKEYRTSNATVIASATVTAGRPSAARAAATASRAVAAALGNTLSVAGGTSPIARERIDVLRRHSWPGRSIQRDSSRGDRI